MTKSQKCFKNLFLAMVIAMLASILALPMTSLWAGSPKKSKAVSQEQVRRPWHFGFGVIPDAIINEEGDNLLFGIGGDLTTGYRGRNKWGMKINLTTEIVGVSDTGVLIGLTGGPVFHLYTHPKRWDPYLFGELGPAFAFDQDSFPPDTGFSVLPVGVGLQVHLRHRVSLYAEIRPRLSVIPDSDLGTFFAIGFPVGFLVHF